MEGFVTLGVKAARGKKKNEELLLWIAGGCVTGAVGAVGACVGSWTAAGRRRNPDQAFGQRTGLCRRWLSGVDYCTLVMEEVN